MTKAQESPEKLAGRRGERREKQKGPEIAASGSRAAQRTWVSMHTARLCAGHEREQGGQCSRKEQKGAGDRLGAKC